MKNSSIPYSKFFPYLLTTIYCLLLLFPSLSYARRPPKISPRLALHKTYTEPSNSIYYFALGQTYDKLAYKEQAIKNYKMGLKYYLGNAYIHYRLSVLYSHNNEIELAQSYIDTALLIKPYETNYKLHKAKLYRQEAKYDIALTIYDKLLFDEPHNKFALSGKITTLSLINPDSAIAYTENLIQSYLNSSWAYAQLSFCYIRLDSIEKSINLMENALTYDSTNTYYLLRLAKWYLISDYLEASINCSQKVLQIEENYKAHLILGKSYKNLMEYEKCIYHYEKGYNLNPNKYTRRALVWGYLTYANNFRKEEKETEAINYYQKIIYIEPEGEVALIAKRALEDGPTPSIAVLEKRILEEPENTYYHYKLAKKYYDDKNYIKSSEHYQIILDLTDDSKYTLSALNGLAWCYYRLEKWKLALKIFYQLRELNYNNKQYSLYISLIYHKLGNIEQANIFRREAGLEDYKRNNNLGWEMISNSDYELAQIYFKEQLATNEININNYWGLGCAYRLNEDYTQALEILQFALNIKPSHKGLHIELARVYQIQNNIEEAIREYELILYLYPDYYAIHYQLGKLYLIDNEYNKAIEHLEKALNFNQKNPYYHYYLGKVYNKMEWYVSALEEFSEAKILLIEAKKELEWLVPIIIDTRWYYAIQLAENGFIDDAIKQFNIIIIEDKEGNYGRAAIEQLKYLE